MTTNHIALETAAEWLAEDRGELYANRERLLIDGREAGVVPVNFLINDSAKLMAAFSLAQEGHLILDPQTPGLLKLTEQGRRLALGAAALQHGER